MSRHFSSTSIVALEIAKKLAEVVLAMKMSCATKRWVYTRDYSAKWKTIFDRIWSMNVINNYMTTSERYACMVGEYAIQDRR